jgi:hypothetical protein
MPLIYDSNVKYLSWKIVDVMQIQNSLITVKWVDEGEEEDTDKGAINLYIFLSCAEKIKIY